MMTIVFATNEIMAHSTSSGALMKGERQHSTFKNVQANLLEGYNGRTVRLAGPEGPQLGAWSFTQTPLVNHTPPCTAIRVVLSWSERTCCPSPGSRWINSLPPTPPTPPSPFTGLSQAREIFTVQLTFDCLKPANTNPWRKELWKNIQVYVFLCARVCVCVWQIQYIHRDIYTHMEMYI